MANGVEISNKWKAWITSDAGKQASDPNSLGTTLSARNYLENRLYNAFMAGVRAAEPSQPEGTRTINHDDYDGNGRERD